MVTVERAYRLPLLITGFASLILGAIGGLARLGLDVPVPAPSSVPSHGFLMVSGFFGTVISLERAVALRAPWTYGGPLFAAIGAIATLAGASIAYSHALAFAASLFMVFACVKGWRMQRAAHSFTLVLGAACWSAAGALGVAGMEIRQLVPWWMAFLVLTIAGERLELSRLLRRPPHAQPLFYAVVAAVLASLATQSTLLFGAALLGLAAWLARYDIAQRTVRERGLTRYIAVCLLSGYLWLAAGGCFALLSGLRDAALHAVLLGFVFSMVFGHAPIIFPAVVKLAVPYTPAFYSHLALLHAGLAVRVIGDSAVMPGWRDAGAAMNAAALALFLLNTITAVIRGRLGSVR
ncbi:MAG: hypothetical protein HY017_13155 [Betaproteobacteria bacterium]|nr:hypothetical protein [Betaproteobacteria bacterium]